MSGFRLDSKPKRGGVPRAGRALDRDRRAIISFIRS
jgi:hypothetical protein